MKRIPLHTRTGLQLAAVIYLCVPSMAAAQGSNRSPLARADSLAMAGDTAGALALLQETALTNTRDAAIWHRLGILASAKTAHVRRRAFVPDQQDISLLLTADSALYRATVLSPGSCRYSLDYARHLFATSVSTLARAAEYLKRCAAPAGYQHDVAAASEAADALGMLYWRRYEQFADRRLLLGVPTLNPDYLLDDRQRVERFLASHTAPLEPPLGIDQYVAAVASFEQAVSLSPGYPPALRHIYMALAESGKWAELRHRATITLSRSPWDAWAWLARAMSSHKLGDYLDATVAFDSALVLLTPRERARYEDISRILRPGDSTSYVHMGAESRRQLHRLFWLTADPLSITSANEHRLEFLARMAYADLRWSSDESNLLGADSDRGQIWVRYGPPGIVASFPPITESTNQGVSMPAGSGFILWYYPKTNLHFVFRAPPTYGLALLLDRYAGIAEEARLQAPASWQNLPINRHLIATIPVQLSRFRASVDSTVIVVHAAIPVSRLVQSRQDDGLELDEAFILHSSDGELLLRDSTRVPVSAPASVSEIRSWRARIRGPREILYRIEALQPDSLRAARAQGGLTITVDTGFGMSDVLLARRVTSRGMEARRWSDYVIAPSVGTYEVGEPVAVLWETYALAASNGSSRYRVDLTVTTVETSRIGRIAARVRDGIKGTVGLRASGQERLTLSFIREAPTQRTFVDYLSLDFGDIAPGRYRLKVEITDLLSNSSASSDRTLTIVR